jgi:hypothetical protein
MTLPESQRHTDRLHPWAVTRIQFRPEQFIPVPISAKAFHQDKFGQVVIGHAMSLGRTPLIESPKRPRKTGTIELLTQPTDRDAVAAIVADLESLTN